MLITCKKSVSDIKSTVGIECTDFNTDDTSVKIWDFAGQLEYTVTHQYFLSSKVLFILNCSVPLSFVSLPHILLS
jgi:hypothetical protein